MGLIDLKTDLKSLKYGKDRVGGGSSKQPFVQKPIPDSFSGIGNTGGLDMFVRGGTLAIGKTADDVSRLTKLLLTPSTFQGPAFTAQQNLLSRQGVQTQASPKGLNEGPYLPTSTLAQVAVSATGLHFNKQGLNPIPGLPGSLSTYSDVVTYTQPIKDNRLVKFIDDFVTKPTSGNTLFSYPGGPGAILGAGETKIQIPIEQRTGINNVNRNYKPVNKYINLKDARLLLGASNFAFLPDTATGIYFDDRLETYSVLIPGVVTKPFIVTKDTAPAGTQTAGVNDQTQTPVTEDNNLTGSLYTPVTGSASNSGLVPDEFKRTSQPTVETLGQNQALENLDVFTYTQEQFKEATSYRQTGQVTDFRQQLRNKNNPTAKAVGANILAPNYNSQNIENRVHLGNPGTKGDVSNYVDGKVVEGKKGALDKINALPIYNSANVASTKDEDVNDLVKFRIAILDANGKGNSSFIHFRAFLDTITDNYSAQWDSFKYVGRGENFYTYGGFERSVSMGWTVFAQSKQELIPMYKKLNFLAASLAPSYKNSFMQGTFAKLTIGGYLYEMPGIIKGLSYELSQEAPWEIGITGEGFVNQQGDSSVKELPHMIKVSGFEFIPIPDFMPQRQTTENGSSRFISLSNGANNNYGK
jgi:hypothetical protein